MGSEGVLEKLHTDTRLYKYQNLRGIIVMEGNEACK